MSFNLSRQQFLQMFAVMQSIKLINCYTAAGAAPGLAWYNGNIQIEQFSTLVSLLSDTPLMSNLQSMPSGSTAPILINPFAKGGYLPHSGPGFVVIPETGDLNIKENVLYGAMDAHISVAFTNLIRKVNTRADHLTIYGPAFSGIAIDCGAYGIFSNRGKLSFDTEDRATATIEVSIPRVFRANEKVSRTLINILNCFIGQTMIDNDFSSCTLIYDEVSKINSVHVRQTHEKTLEQKLMECPIWATW
ncbi:TPA: hypothetical protein ACIAU9_003656 [Salmonella enterica subsp. enterica serovar Typhimurium]|uniref:hypothetical protein n=1 Tax=Salmonella enterica TaxID=28901 RepID=UPI001D305281|nr:hypothetical protein [Salmonella enterica]EHI5013626.1 hypothetical protein [Salmonella enterica]EHJ2180789.1 hypothetical protein [Salmonella enterica]MDJ4173046.1 hypothetical protein [Salmonella enterica]MDJ4432752.1 hypothetical protein [Salmonella enterica]MDJ4978037.1 hypothetical protein [Salmonella enterica]